MQPSKSTNGFSVGFKLMFDKSIQSIIEPKFIMDTGSTEGGFISLYIEKGEFICILGMGRSLWKVSMHFFFFFFK